MRARKGPGNRKSEGRRVSRAIKAALVRAGVSFVDGLRQDRTTNPITESIDNQPKEAA